ncbi:histidine phosphatase family protein [Kaistia dalseonensis]|uniref:Phosphohistidine phosphatase n=1 Tax=Kaistia dalseonensis TaxID=410840 RepID=A0ABU0HDV2_9HYPH|nr:histidine phosphatase family protein [Kaistia dalseonensis]MCX5497050.1 histidine phosphatase family protein [Kaistia dalseonensis]MDQ0439676.1 phosphohistidine phosphatase [Kaistia dalseonensis]
MTRLLLLRHAKSSWDQAGLADFDRPLAARGRRAATMIGEHLATHRLVPDRVLCSSARRTRETLIGLLPLIAADLDIKITRDLYEVGADAYIDSINALGANARTLLVIGHNPAIQETAIELIGSGNPALRDEIAEKFPTAGLAVIDFDVHKWSELRPKTGRVVAFFRPRELELVGSEPPSDDE